MAKIEIQTQTESYQENVYFNEGGYKIDFILVYKRKTKYLEEINIFLKNLKARGVLIEIDRPTENRYLVFAKVHGPHKVLLKNAALYSISLSKDKSIELPLSKVPFKFLENPLNSSNPDPNDPINKRAWETISKAKPKTITSCERGVILFTIMDYIQFNAEPSIDFGIRQMLFKKILVAAYPLHDGRWEWDNKCFQQMSPYVANERINDRQLLACYWATYWAIFKQQPLNTIQQYFGYEIAMYFAWFGLYIKMLLYLSIMGILTYVIGIIVTFVVDPELINNMCNTSVPLCNALLMYKQKYDDLLKINDTCFYIKMSFLNTNAGSFVYSIILVIWCTIFKEMWKREYNVLNVRWCQPLSEDFTLRPQFLAKASKTRKHEYTGEPELYISVCELTMRYFFSGFCTVLMIGVVVVVLYGIIHLEYVLTLNSIDYVAMNFITSLVYLVAMCILEIVFDDNLLRLLTIVEMPRTQLDYEKSVLIKSSIFLFFNSYGRLIYISFFKGYFLTFNEYITNPKTKHEKYSFPTEMCLPPSCTLEVFILLLTVIMFKPIIHFKIQSVKIWYYKYILRFEVNKEKQRWEKEFNDMPYDINTMLRGLQLLIFNVGFVTFFTQSCSLVPLVALLVNLIRIRQNAIKIVKVFRRPVERKQITSIGVCFDVFETMSYLAIIINALFAAYTSKYINYGHYYYSFINKTTVIPLTAFGFTQVSYQNHSDNTFTSCFVNDYIKPDQLHSEKKYVLEYFDLFALKTYLALAFMLGGFLISGTISYAIPDIPRELQEFIHYHEQKEKLKDA